MIDIHAKPASPDPAYRIRLVLEYTEDFTAGQWRELKSETLRVYDDSPSSNTFGVGAKAIKAANMFFDGILRERKEATVRGGKGVV